MEKDIYSIFNLTDKVAIITGASRGIGVEIATIYAKAGAKVVICSREKSRIYEAGKKIKDSGGKVLTVEANVAKEEDRKNLIKSAMDWASQIDILVNNAGTNPAFGPLADVQKTAWDKVLEVNLNAALFLSQLVYHTWMKEHGGVIINVSSVGGLMPSMGINAYNVTKAALMHLTRCLASEWGQNGIRVNALAPGIIKTHLSEALWDNPIAAEAIQRYPISRFGDVTDIKGAALFLASGASSYVTGHSLVIDGGQLIKTNGFGLA